MPTYEYLCRHCGHRFEAWQKMTDDPLTTCPQCGESIHRVLYPAGIVFKGSGFYKTEYGSGSSNGKANSSENKSETAESKSATETTKTEAAKTESSGITSSPTPAAAD